MKLLKIIFESTGALAVFLILAFLLLWAFTIHEMFCTTSCWGG